MKPARIWSLIKQAVHHNSDMSSSLPYAQFENENYSDDQLDIPKSPRDIKVYHIDGTYETVSVTLSTTAEEVCSQIGKDFFSECFGWSIVELWKDEGIERTLENHESVLTCFHKMKNGKNRILVLQLNNKMFHMFKHPEKFSLYKTLDIAKKKEAKLIEVI
ncbi:PREDICTED: uncharacterized protein LOC107161473 [Diuraphis noxia]|uniref:uncharacterized protein LOC107161473 n=1 Tax=Diuraphis noxia TaxID=143948 RepID=UPI00076364C7|nr:PREDICTED: uncharacterized protein LOC107161473 [Diuraphis noxia]